MITANLFKLKKSCLPRDTNALVYLDHNRLILQDGVANLHRIGGIGVADNDRWRRRLPEGRWDQTEEAEGRSGNRSAPEKARGGFHGQATFSVSAARRRRISNCKIPEKWDVSALLG